MKTTETPLFFAIEPEKLWEKIRELLREELAKYSDHKVEYKVPGLTQKPVFKAAEVCAIFGITRQTLHMWNKDNILKPKKIKSRTFYLWQDLERLINNVPE